MNLETFAPVFSILSILRLKDDAWLQHLNVPPFQSLSLSLTLSLMNQLPVPDPQKQLITYNYLYIFQILFLYLHEVE